MEHFNLSLLIISKNLKFFYLYVFQQDTSILNFYSTVSLFFIDKKYASFVLNLYQNHFHSNILIIDLKRMSLLPEINKNYYYIELNSF